jgi:hypothetical protein
MKRASISARSAINRALSLVVLLSATSSAVAELSHDVRQLSGLLGEQATNASKKLDSHTEAVRIKGLFEGALNHLAQANNLIAVTTVQTFAETKSVGIGFVTISKPPIIIQIAARNGELLTEYVKCGDETLVDYDWRKSFDVLAQTLKHIAAGASVATAEQAEELRDEVEKGAAATGFTVEIMQEPGFCSITAKKAGLTVHAWALNGEASSHVSTEGVFSR